MNKADSATFLLKSGKSSRICKIADKTIIIGEMVEIGFYAKCFYDKYVYDLKLENGGTRASFFHLHI